MCWFVGILIGFIIFFLISWLHVPTESEISDPVFDDWLVGEYDSAAAFWEQDENITFAYTVIPDSSLLILNADGSYEMHLEVSVGRGRDVLYETHQSGTYRTSISAFEDRSSEWRIPAFEGLIEFIPDGQKCLGVDFALTKNYLKFEPSMVLRLPFSGGYIRIRNWDKKAIGSHYN